MKKFTQIVLSSILLSFVLNGCQISNEIKVKEVNSSKKIQLLDVREAVWNQLSKKNKEHVVGTWKDANVQKIILHESMGIIKDKTYIGEEVYLVSFPSNENPTIGDIVVFADIKSHRLIGIGYRD